MLDVEFISELAIAYLHGHQNKKDKLDDWYQAYEVEFPRQNEVRRVFNEVLSEVTGIFGESRLGRWSKKSDFYSLFLVIASHHEDLPLARDQRATARRRLAMFSRQVEIYLADPESAKVGRSPRDYARAVERAASDIANRRARFDALNRRLFPAS
jgi:hypothetical protein